MNENEQQSDNQEKNLDQNLDNNGQEKENINNKDNTENKGLDNIEEDNGEKKSDNEEIYGSPENFDYSSIKLPEGMEFDEELLKEFEPVAKKLNLSNKSANELMSLAVKLTEKNASKFSDVAQQIQKAKADSYLQLLNEDKELNVGDNAKYEAYLDVAIQGLKAVATDGFIDLLKTEGLTHHPDFIKTFHKIGELCASEKMPDVKIPPTQKVLDAADILYGTPEEKE